MAYYRAIATFRQVNVGYAEDGQSLTGLVRCERYGDQLQIEASLIGLCPLREGRYVYAFTDGDRIVTFQGNTYQEVSKLDLSCGFACALFAVHKQVVCVAMACHGGREYLITKLQRYMEELQQAEVTTAPNEYQDEAITDVNYYALDGLGEEQSPLHTSQKTQEDESPLCVYDHAVDDGQKEEQVTDSPQPITPEGTPVYVEESVGFFEQVKGEINNLFAVYPRITALEAVVAHSKFVKISYDGVRYYAFGVLYEGDRPTYLAYGVQGERDNPPKSFVGYRTFVPTAEGDYWLLYQDAQTGKQVSTEGE